MGKCTGKHPSVRELCLECSREEGAGPRPLTPRQGHALPDAHSRATPPDAHGKATPSDAHGRAWGTARMPFAGLRDLLHHPVLCSTSRRMLETTKTS